MCYSMIRVNERVCFSCFTLRELQCVWLYAFLMQVYLPLAYSSVVLVINAKMTLMNVKCCTKYTSDGHKLRQQTFNIK